MKNIYLKSLHILAALVLFLLFGNVILQIFSRTFLVKVPIWTEEVGKYLLVWFVAISSGILFFERDPIGIDLIYKRLPRLWRNVILIISLVASAWFGFMLAYGSLTLVERGRFIRTPALNLQLSYVYSSLTLIGIVMLIAMVIKLLNYIKKIIQNDKTSRDK
jgi:TRAP-type C4-dicarboxylate transport system permease small subunit